MSTPELPAEERAELAALRGEVAKLRKGKSRRWRRGGRWIAATALLVVAALLGGIAVIATFVRAELLDTDTYVATVAPLAKDPAIQTAVADRLTTEIVNAAKLDQITEQTVQALENVGAPKLLDSLVGTLSGAIETFVGRKVTEIVQSDAFAQAWADANRVAHDQMNAVLTGQDTDLVQTSGGTTVSVDLGAFLDVLKERLVAGGLTFVGKIPSVSITFTVFESPDVAKIQRWARMLNRLANWLPWIVLALLIAGIAIAPRRRTAILFAGIYLLIVSGVLVLALPVARTYYLNHLPAGVSPEAAATVYDQVVGLLANGLKALFVAAVIWVVVAFLAGPSRIAAGVRAFVVRASEMVARFLGHLWPPLGRAGQNVARWARPIELAAVAVAVVVLLTGRPGPAGVLWTALGLGVFVLLLEILVRVPPPIQSEPVAS